MLEMQQLKQPCSKAEIVAGGTSSTDSEEKPHYLCTHVKDNIVLWMYCKF
jgi:hypothetical protein